MNIDQQNRFDIMQALEKEFPDRLLEDLIEVARYVEAGGIEQDRAGSQDSAPKSLWEAAYLSEPRKWTTLEHIPADVWAVTDADGDVIRRVWKLEDPRYAPTTVNDNFAPFTELLS